MARISMKAIESLVRQLNKLEGFENPKYSTVGAYTIDGAYGGWQLQRYCNESGGVSTISKGGYTSKRDLYNQVSVLVEYAYEKKMVNA